MADVIQVFDGDGHPWASDVWHGYRIVLPVLKAKVPADVPQDQILTVMEDWNGWLLREITRFQQVGNFTSTAIHALHEDGDEPLSFLYKKTQAELARMILGLYRRKAEAEK